MSFTNWASACTLSVDNQDRLSDFYRWVHTDCCETVIDHIVDAVEVRLKTLLLAGWDVLEVIIQGIAKLAIRLVESLY